MGTDWSVEVDLLDDESDDWTSGIDEETLRLDGHSWCAKPSALDPNASSENTVLSFGGWDASELRVSAADLDIDSALLQGDSDDWYILLEPS